MMVIRATLMAAIVVAARITAHQQRPADAGFTWFILILLILAWLLVEEVTE